MLKENYQMDASKTKLHQCKLYQGNCLEKLGDFSNSSVHLVITDPPYFLDGMGSIWDKDILEQKAAKGETVKGLPVGMKFDPKQGLEFQKFYEKISKEIIRVLKPGGFFLSFSQPRLLHRMGVAVEDAGFEIRDQYAWRFTKKAQAKAFSQNHFINKMKISDHKKEIIKQKLGNRKTPQLRPEFESILVAQKPKDGTFINNWLAHETGLVNTYPSGDNKTASTVFTIEKPKKHKFNSHLTVKPVALIEQLIKVFSVENQVVLDPFLGSGTTLIATENTNRQGIGIELNPEYVEIAKERILRGE